MRGGWGVFWRDAEKYKDFSFSPKGEFLRLSEGSHWFECSLLPYVIFCFFGFPLGSRLTYCVVGGGWWVGVLSQTETKNAIIGVRTQADQN